MEFILSKQSPEEMKCDLFAIGCFEKEVKEGKEPKPAELCRSDGGLALDKKLNGEISNLIKASSFTGAVGKMRLIYTEGRLPAKHLLLVGMGKEKEAKIEHLRNATAKIAKAADEIKATSIALVLQKSEVLEKKPAERLRTMVEGFILGRYSYEIYKAKKSRQKKTLSKIYVLTSESDGELKKAIQTGEKIAYATQFARNLGNTPGNDLTPKTLARFARDVAGKGKLKYREMGPQQIKKEKMEAFLAVAQGSPQPPVLMHMHYKPTKASRAKVAIIGKGITFDAGGISIKPSRGMEEMKSDMSAAAAVIATMQAIAELKPSVTIDAYICAAENMPDGKAVKPGDIVTARNGKTIEFISTDAEGRMLLADVLSYASDKKPDYLIDIATLTGTCPYAVGEKYAAIIGSDQNLIDKLKRAGDEAGDYVWQLPLEKDYMKGLTTGPADLKNLGSSKADTINGALFLSNFIGEIPWAHIDIASTAWTSDPSDISPKGATGAGVGLLTQFLMNF